MEELLTHPILTLTLAPSFNLSQWSILSQETSSSYQSRMLALSRLLHQHQHSLSKQYHTFTQNHLTLSRWHQMANFQKRQIQPYLFALPQHPKLDKKAKLGSVGKLTRREPNAVRKYFADSTEMWADIQNVNPSPINHYELYMQTFSACRGKRYAPYDYAKHMRSSQDRKKYNDYIRPQHRRNHTNPTHKEHSLEHFEEWQPNLPVKTSLANFRGVLGDFHLNSQHGLRKLLKRQGAHKLVLVNHQRKPVNYYMDHKNKKTKTEPQ